MWEALCKLALPSKMWCNTQEFWNSEVSETLASEWITNTMYLLSLSEKYV